MRRDSELLALCDRFFDAIERKDFDTVEQCYAPELVVWHSHDCLYQSRESNLATLRDGMSRFKKMRYRNRRIHAFEGGFVQQHTLFVTHPNDFVGQMDVCFVAYTRDGRISRAYEYFDLGQIEKFLGPRP
jgi:ketosteroid isomerase-like protein